MADVLDDLDTPAFIVNLCAFRKNCQRVLDTATRNSVKLRPHIKTHKTLEGAWIQAVGEGTSVRECVSGFCCSTVPEVELMFKSQKGGPFNDVVYAIPVSESKLKRLDPLREGGKTLHILVDNPEQVTMIESFSEKNLSDVWSVFMKVDTGYHRAGVLPNEHGASLAKRIAVSKYATLTGLYSHCGHSYDANSELDAQAVVQQDHESLEQLLTLLRKEGVDVDNLVVSVGSTPSIPHHSAVEKRLPNLELHAGNYTFYDRQQLWTGACPQEKDQAGRVLATVIGRYDDRILLDAGATALSKDATPQGGMCVITNHNEVECYAVSQEVTRARSKNGVPSIPLGSKVALIPNHSCLAAACFDRYYVIDDPTCSFSPTEIVRQSWVPAKFF